MEHAAKIEGRHLYATLPGAGGATIPTLRDVSIAVAPGEIVGLIGPNGSGKTTLLRALAGFLPAQGEVWLDGRPLADFSRRQIAQRLAFVHQKTNIPFAFSVRQIVELGRAPFLSPWQQLEKKDRQIVEAALKRCGCMAFASRPVTELSGGELQRVMLARSLAQSPEILLADEPASGMDIAQSHTTFELLREIARDGCAVIVVVHELPLAAGYCDRLALMHQGSLLAQGLPEQVLTAQTLNIAYGMTLTGYTDPAGGWNYYLTQTNSHKEKP